MHAYVVILGAFMVAGGRGGSRHARIIRLSRRSDPCRIHRPPSLTLRLSPARSAGLNRYVCVQQHVKVTQVNACMHDLR
jgi:hypothetical protein